MVRITFLKSFNCQVLQLASGEVVVLIDSHVELGTEWWLPLLNITQSNYRAVVVPVLDMHYNDRTDHLDMVKVDFDMWFKWEDSTVYGEGAPFISGAMIGAAYGLTKRWLEEIDYFGRGLQGWGGENIEVGIKTWRCGGEVWTVPCFRVLHHGARRNPIDAGGRPMAKDSSYNVRMLSETHHDERGKRLVEQRYGWKDDLDWAAVNHTKVVMNELQCKPLQWVYDNVMPGVSTFEEGKLIGYKVMPAGQTNTCLEFNNDDSTLILRNCSQSNDGKPWRLVRLTRDGFLRHDRDCFDGGYEIPRFANCHFGKMQQFRYEVNQQLAHMYWEGRCLGVNSDGIGVMEGCKEGSSRWTFGTKFNEN